MTVLQVEKNAAALTMVVTTEFTASIDNVWRLWTDAALFERWWGPPGMSPVSEEHDVTPGGRIAFFFTTPEGEKYPNVWEVLEVDPPTRLVLRDADVDDDGMPIDGNSLTRFEIDIVAAGDKTRMLLTSHFDSTAGMEQAIAMGIEEGMQLTLDKIDAVLTEVAA